MSIEKVKVEITRFLEIQKAGVLCIRGNWGTGKTYSWQETLKVAVANNKVGRNKYAYVSLFGTNSLADLKQEIIHNNKGVSEVGKPFNYKDVGSYVKGTFPGILKLGSLAGKFLGENYTSTGVAVMYMFVRDSLICIDDLERKGKHLRSADVLGLVSQLREDRNCKVVILLNDEHLEGEDRAEFESYLEKAVDINLRFNPTPMECAEIALEALDGADELKLLVKERTTVLKIDNVRAIRKLYSFVRQIEPLLEDYESRVFHSVAQTIVLMGWCHLQPEIAPSKDALIRNKYTRLSYLSSEESELTPQEKEWVRLIADYGYSHTDKFDIALLRGIEDGYFTKEIIDKHATELNQKVETDTATAELEEVWHKFRNTFDDDLGENIKRFEGCVVKNARFYPLIDMIAVVSLFRNLNRKDEGDALLDVYLEARRGVSGAYNFEDVELFGRRLDDDIKEKLLALQKKEQPSMPIDELFLMLHDDGHNAEITEQVAAAPVEEYVRILKCHDGDDFELLRRGLTQYNNLTNPDAHNFKIMQKANDALIQIGDQNLINKVRVSHWGIAQRLAKMQPDKPQPEGEVEGPIR